MNKKTISYGMHNITSEDIDAVVTVLKSDFLTQGPNVKMFEDAFAEYIGCDYALAVGNGTAALHLCILALDLKPGERVITTPLTFVATANSIRYCGGEVDFADIDPDTYVIDLEAVRKKLESAPRGTYKGIIVVDFAGKAVNLEEFKSLADKFGCWIVEDACHAPGGFFIDSKGVQQNCGNGKFADLSVFSFHPVKHIACGEGGMITTNNKALYDKMRNLRTHGIQQNPALREYNHGIWYYEMQELGYNYRLADINAALGLSQLSRAEAGLEKRRDIALFYQKEFANFKPVHSQTGVVEGHAYHLYVIEIDNRDGLISHLRENNIFAQVHYIPVHLMPYYRNLGWTDGDMPVIEDYYTRCLSIPIYPTLSEEEQKYVVKCIKDFYE
jgi:UDP-4-amino-4,6-dideoxy-N-acetyl-beta-L-altrosamine transaminase